MDINEEVYYACKCIDKAKLEKSDNMNALKMEIETMSKISH